ncbi:MAG: sulfurtransferase [Thermoactinomyces sp.]
MKYVVSMEWLKEHLDDPDVLIFDCRFTLGQPDLGYTLYQQEHIPGAQYIDVEKDLSDLHKKTGSRHPLPDPQKLADLLGRRGVNEKRIVVAYDDQFGAMAGRFWWLLTYLGHPHARVLNGTFHEWKEKGFPVTDQIIQPAPCLFKTDLQNQLLASMAEVKSKLDDPGTLLIDSREEKRYLGLEEPIDPIAGHIPGAKNYFYQSVWSQGRWKNRSSLQKHFQALDPSREIIVYCGSGITATPNFLALKEAGFQKVELYAGSWSEWISDRDNPVETGSSQ